MKKLYSLFAALMCGVMLSFASAATIKVHIPQDGSMSWWTLGTVYFWAWDTGQGGTDIMGTAEGNGWYSADITKGNFLVKDQAGWDNFPGTSHQSVDMTVSGDACYEMSNGQNIDGNGDSWKKNLTATVCGGGGDPITPPVSGGSYYVAGFNDNWASDAYPMTDGSLTISLAAGTHQFKVTDGTWGTAGVNNWGFGNYDATCSTISCSASDEVNRNVQFSLTVASEVTISWDGTKICVNGEGGGDPITPPISGGSYYVAGLGGNWEANAYPMTDGSLTVALEAGEHQFKVTDGTWGNAGVNNWGFYYYDATCSTITAENSDEVSWNVKITLDAAANVTISFDGTKICITTDGETPVTPPITPPAGPAYIEYPTAHPAGIEDVMLQGFYWDSNQETHAAVGNGGDHQSYTMSYYGPTRWDNLLEQVGELAQYFDLIWLPPSAKSSGGLGYHPVQMSNQNSDLGSSRSLKSLISNLHQGGCKVIADIVVNHRGNVSSWCDFAKDNFSCTDGTTYGVYQFTPKEITGDDEVWSSTDAGARTCQTATPSGQRGAYDTGEHYAPARDLDHTSTTVRNSIKSYLKWLRHEMQYDGLRWDVAGGFGQGYLGEYVDAAKPYISMAEKWEGNAQKLWEFIGRTGNMTGGLDFAVKYSACNDGISAGNYYKLMGAGLPGLGHAEYSVPFIDNHDTFERFDTDPAENNEMNGKGSFQRALKSIGSVTPTVAQARGNTDINKVLQANAFLLGMPGTPCVFYPHWVALKTQIKEMIIARKSVGITNTSTVNDEAGNGYYKATIYGNRGEMLLRIGPSSDYTNCPSGYTRAAGGQSGDNYAMFVKVNQPSKPDLAVSPVGGKYIGGTQVQMTATFNGVIYYTLDGTTPSATNGTQYTGPIQITVNNTVLKAVAINAAGSSPVQTHTYITERVVRTEPIVIKFRKPAAWTGANIWAWDKDGNQLASSSSTWPGDAAMTDNGDGWWSFTFPISVDEIDGGLLFNDGKRTGTKQTGNYDEVVSESTCFDWSGETGDSPLVVSCDGTALPEVKTAEIYIYPNPVTETLYITGEDAANARLQVYDITGRMVINTVNTTGTLQVSTLTTGMYIMRVVDTEGRQMQHHFIKR